MKQVKKDYSVILKVIYLAISAILSTDGFAQKDTIPSRRNAIFFEIGGAAGAHSMNYERAFNMQPKMDLGLRIGLSVSNILDYNGKFNPNIVIPAMVSGMYGRYHKLELGIGETFSSIIESNSGTGNPERRSNLSTTFNIGYRYQNPHSRVMFRAGYTPYIEFNERFKHWGGISIGYNF